ncbi:PIN domain-containing protein [Turneriella parva]|uniref:PIN domain-containing protein n=1 Tax=Turneriella parva TaxID=29510 RepID=UPI0009FE897A
MFRSTEFATVAGIFFVAAGCGFRFVQTRGTWLSPPDPADQHYFEAVFAGLTILPVDSDIISQAIMIRKAHNMKTADAIIAATAMHANCSLLTANTTDFKKVQGLALADMPIALA